MLSLLISFSHKLVHLSSKRILTKSEAALNSVIVSPDSLSAKFTGYVLATPFTEKHFVTKLRYHIDPRWLYCRVATFLTHASAKGMLAANARHEMIAQKSGSKAQERGDNNVQSFEFIHLRCLASLVGFSTLSQHIFPLNIDALSYLHKL